MPAAKGPNRIEDYQRYLETLANTRFNFFLVFFALVMTCAVNSRDPIHLRLVLTIGAVISLLIATAIARAHRKMNVAFEKVLDVKNSPAKVVADAVSSGFPGSTRNLIGYMVPALCCALLVVAAFAAWLGALDPAPATSGLNLAIASPSLHVGTNQRQTWLSPDARAALVGTLSGVVIGFLLKVLADWWRRRGRAKANLGALSAELDYCGKQAQVYRTDDKSAPLYRLPTMVYSTCFPALLADGKLNKHQCEALIRFFDEAEALNRGLDQAQAVRSDAAALKVEVDRNKMKAARLCAGDGGTYYENARKALDALK